MTEKDLCLRPVGTTSNNGLDLIRHYVELRHTKREFLAKFNVNTKQSSGAQKDRLSPNQIHHTYV